MARVERPLKPDFFPVFPMHLLVDEDYEHLTRAEWGSVFLLMQHQWMKGGTLPEDPAKLAQMARCNAGELAELMTRWPKLQPVDGQPGRVAIPWLLQEYHRAVASWEAFRDRQAEKGRKSAEARAAAAAAATIRDGGAPGEPEANPPAPTGEQQANRGSTTVQPPSHPIPSHPIPTMEESKDSSSGPAARAKEVVETWNRVTEGKLAKAKLTPKRETVIRTRLKEKGWLEDFQAACGYLVTSAFHLGQNDRGWTASLDYLLQPGKATELAEKAAAPRPGAHPQTRSPSHRARVDEAYIESLKTQPQPPQEESSESVRERAAQVRQLFG